MTDQRRCTGPHILLTTNDPEHCVQALLHLFGSQLPDGTAITVIVHAQDDVGAGMVGLVDRVEQSCPPHVGIRVGAIGEGTVEEAINTGVRMLPRDVEHLAVLTQDVRVVAGWLQGLQTGTSPSVVHGLGDRTMAGIGSIGLVGACCDQTTSEAQRIDLTEQEVQMGLGQYAAARLAHFGSAVSLAEVLDGFCVLLTGEALRALGDGDLLRADCGAWAWSDLCLRAADAGLRSVVSESVYVGREAAVPPGGQVPGNVSHRLAFYEHHPVQESHRIVAVVLADMRNLRDLQRLRACVSRLASLVHGVALVATNNPLDVQDDPAFRMAARRLPAVDRRLMKQCSGADAIQVGEALRTWAAAVGLRMPVHRLGALSFATEVYVGPPSRRAQCNTGLRMAERLGATAVLLLHGDEVVEDSMTHEQLLRVLQHPNPLVRCFDVGLCYHHDSATLVRDDQPWGHGGTYRGGAHGARLYRLRGGQAGLVLPGEHPSMLPDHGVTAHRVAAMRLRRFQLASPDDRRTHGVNESGEGLRVSQWTDDTRMGLHVLLWRGEDPEDLARWLDQLHSMIDHVVLVWTDEWEPGDQAWVNASMLGTPLPADSDWPATGPSRQLASVALHHRAAWVVQPLNNNIAEARNAGITALADRGLTWAMFVDPDEWLPNPLRDCVTLRNMAVSSRWGWLFQVANYRHGSTVPTISDSVRISRLDPHGRMRMDGRVHEGFGRSIQALQADGIHPRLSYAPFVLQHRGLAQDAEAMDRKLAKYERLLRLQLQEHPHDPGAWVSLGWHYFNDGHPDEGVECYRRAIACAGTAYLPFKEMGFFHLRAARELFEQCSARLVDSHQFAGLLGEMVEWLQRYAPPAPVVPRMADRPSAPLPEWQPPASDDAAG